VQGAASRREEQRVVDERGPFVEVARGLGAVFGAVNELGAQPGEIGPQIVRDRREHPRALVHQGPDLRLHVVEGSGQLTTSRGDGCLRRDELAKSRPILFERADTNGDRRVDQAEAAAAKAAELRRKR